MPRTNPRHVMADLVGPEILRTWNLQPPLTGSALSLLCHPLRWRRKPVPSSARRLNQPARAPCISTKEPQSQAPKLPDPTRPVTVCR